MAAALVKGKGRVLCTGIPEGVTSDTTALVAKRVNKVSSELKCLSRFMKRCS